MSKPSKEYGSVYEWVRYEFLKPYLVIGGSEEKFWSLTPKTLKFYFEVHKEKQKIEEQKMWLMGQYIRNAIASVEVVAVSVPILDDKSARKLKPQEYPKCPHISEEDKANDKTWVENEKQKLVVWLNSFKKKTN